MPNGDDKNWVRLCWALIGFREKHGHWPTRLVVPGEGYIDNLRDDLFGPESFALVEKKLKIVAGNKFAAYDSKKRCFSYSREEIPQVGGDPWAEVEAYLGTGPTRYREHEEEIYGKIHGK